MKRVLLFIIAVISVSLTAMNDLDEFEQRAAEIAELNRHRESDDELNEQKEIPDEIAATQIDEDKPPTPPIEKKQTPLKKKISLNPSRLRKSDYQKVKNYYLKNNEDFIDACKQLMLLSAQVDLDSAHILNLSGSAKKYTGEIKITDLVNDIKTLTEMAKLRLKLKTGQTDDYIENELHEAKRNIQILELDVSHNRLETLPTDINQLHDLVHLDCSNNILENIPVITFKHLEQLKFSNNQLAKFPDQITDLSTLKSLDLSYNYLTELPDTIAKLTALLDLNVSFNRLTKLSERIYKLPLIVLNIEHNRLDKLPDIIDRLLTKEGYKQSEKDRMHLFIRPGKSSLPVSVWHKLPPVTPNPAVTLNDLCKNLMILSINDDDIKLDNGKTLYLSNKIKKYAKKYPLGSNLRQHLETLVGLAQARLKLYNHGQRYIDKEILTERSRRVIPFIYLDLSNNALDTIEFDKSLTCLEGLLCPRNKFTAIPKTLFYLTNLRTLDLSENAIEEIPEDIGLLTNLVILSFNGNRLKNVPDVITKLTNLTSLDVSDNELRDVYSDRKLIKSGLPQSIGALQELTELFLENNQLYHLPHDLGEKLTKLQRLNYKDNPLHSLPPKTENLPALSPKSQKLAQETRSELTKPIITHFIKGQGGTNPNKHMGPFHRLPHERKTQST